MPVLRCPRCNGSLSPPAGGALDAHPCTTCGGVFIGHAVARGIDAAGVAQALHRIAADAARRAPFGASLGVAPVARPGCGAVMEQRSYGRAQIVVDVCARHGVWFDRGELQRATERAAAPFRDARSAEPARVRPAVLELPPLDPNYVLPKPAPPLEPTNPLFEFLELLS